MTQNTTIQEWHRIVEELDLDGLDRILTEDVVFSSPVVYRPQEGKAVTFKYLTTAFQVLNNDSFTYLREIVDGNNAALEFQTVIDGITVNGVDMIAWREDGCIYDFKVMIRPLKAIDIVHRKMGEMLEKVKQ